MVVLHCLDQAFQAVEMEATFGSVGWASRRSRDVIGRYWKLEAGHQPSPKSKRQQPFLYSGTYLDILAVGAKNDAKVVEDVTSVDPWLSGFQAFAPQKGPNLVGPWVAYQL